jgi:hypothetical protein
MTLVAAWYRSLDGGHAVFCANDSAPNLGYLRDVEAASGILTGSGPDAAITRNPRQDVQHARRPRCGGLDGRVHSVPPWCPRTDEVRIAAGR